MRETCGLADAASKYQPREITGAAAAQVRQ
jgi:hypothetical protein